MNHEKAFRKVLVNTLAASLGIFSDATLLTNDAALAFTVDSVLLGVACLGSMFAVAWPLYLSYLAGDLEGDYDPVKFGNAPRYAYSLLLATTNYN